MPNFGTGFDRSDIKSDKVPQVPIKTYKWEDLRRARRKGGYPWTYLDKEALDETVPLDNFKMEGLKKSKTSSASSASDSLEIKEITEDDVKGLEGIDSSYVVIESPILLGRQISEPMKEQEGIIESADSSDDISQYLDKEERGPEERLSTETLTLPSPDASKGNQMERAKSEEPKRKRKLSVESNYSRISLSKLGMMKRLKEAKEKIKLPKFGGNTKKEKVIEAATEAAQLEKTKIRPPSSKNEKPVYIHIPLKPPEGEEDEFSYLEFGEKKPSATPVVQIEVAEEEDKEETKENISEENEQSNPREEAPSQNNLGLSAPDDQEDDVSAIIFLEGEEGCDAKGDYDIIAVDIDENSKEMKMSAITNTEVRRQVLESIKKVESQPDISKSSESPKVSLSRSSSKASKVSKTSIRKRRAKSVEPEKKRRGSIDSSYSRKSLSRIGLMKKLKQIHIPFLKSPSKKSISEAPSTTVEPEAQKETPKQVPSKEQKPLYIHIPLKPPDGETDEFSHLEFGDAAPAPPPQPKIEKNETIDSVESDLSPVETPQTSKSPQFIVLTPPSDDELLDRPDIPETPSSETGGFFQIGELQQLAKDSVDQILESLEEETEQKDEENVVNVQPPVETTTEDEVQELEESPDKDKLTIDEEDGLKSISTNDDTKPNLKSNLKGESSPLPKKKVSFKRRKSSQISKDDGYEEIESPASSVTVESCVVSENVGDVSESRVVGSASSHEGESDLKSDKDAKTTSKSSEEDFNRWSKISDHEYEPINPPPEEKTESVPAKSHVSEVLNPSSMRTHQYSDDNLSVAKNEEPRTSPGRSSPSRRSRSRSEEKDPSKPNKFQTAIRESASKFKTKLQGIKKPTISMPSRPKFQKPNFKKPSINLPKLPDLSSTFRRTPKKEEVKSGESADGEDSSNKGIFDFSTYPRIFKKKKRDHDSTSLKENEEEMVEKKARQVKKSGAPDIIRIPLHSEESMEKENGIYPEPEEILEVGQIETNDFSSPHQYQEDIEVDDEDVRMEGHEQQRVIHSEEENSRWDHGNFYRSQNGAEKINDNEEDVVNEEEKVEEFTLERNDFEEKQSEMVTDLDLPEETQTPFIPMRNKGRLQQNDSFETNHSRDVGSSVSSLGQHRQGVLEEIDSDQFFLREKGISQDNIDMGKYLSTEIREAFRSPANALSEIHYYNFDESRASNQSLPETKRKQVKKPKRRKTPHSSQERLRYEPESENEDYNFMPPIRPKRKSRRKKRAEPEFETMPYRETISMEPAQRSNYSPDLEDHPRHYENDQNRRTQYPHAIGSEPYNQQRLHVIDHHDAHRRASEPTPAAPARKHKSLKSLNASEHESIFEDYERNDDENAMSRYEDKGVFNSSDMHQRHPSNHFENTSPPKPPTRSRSKTISRATSQADRDSILGRMDSIMFDEEFREPAIEEPCIKDLRDAMGYAIVDKNQNKNWEHKFCTVPRSQGSNQPPERPLRNYSTLGPSRPVRKPSRNMTDEEKENIDISQYIEIEDERDLQSGEVIQKIQNRPLPAPPRPPRIKSRPLTDITSRSNVEMDTVGGVSEEKYQIDETEVSTQTEPLPPDFQCEEMVQEETDRIMTPSALRKNDAKTVEDIEPDLAEIRVKRILITPTQHSYEEETITHSQLLVEPLNGARILPDSDISCEKTIPVPSDEGETSEIPEEFHQLSDPHMVPASEITSAPESHLELSKEDTEFTSDSTMSPGEKLDQTAQNDKAADITLDKQEVGSSDPISDEEIPPRPRRTLPQRTENVEVLKTQKLQVSDLDVERLTVNELVANKIVVSEIEGGNITAHEISSKCGKLKLSDLDLQPEVVKKLLEQLKESSSQPRSQIDERTADVGSTDGDGEKKKTSSEFRDLEACLSQESAATPVLILDESNSKSTLASEDITSNSHNHHSSQIIEASSQENDSEVGATEFCPRSELYKKITTDSNAAVDAISSIISPMKLTVGTSGGDENINTDHRGVSDGLVDKQTIESEENISNVDDTIPTDGAETEIIPNIDNSVKENESNRPPVRPPRYPDKRQSVSDSRLTENTTEERLESAPKEDETSETLRLLEPDVDDEPPPRPPQPQVPYIPSQPPTSFYALRAQQCVEDLSEDIPLVPRRKRNHRPTTISKSSSSDSNSVPIARRRVRSPEPSIPQLTGQLMGACSVVARNKIKRLIDEVNSKISKDNEADANKQNVQVIMVVLLVLIAVLLLLGYGDGKTVHLHHWEYFNPPTDI